MYSLEPIASIALLTAFIARANDTGLKDGLDVAFCVPTSSTSACLVGLNYPKSGRRIKFGPVF